MALPRLSFFVSSCLVIAPLFVACGAGSDGGKDSDGSDASDGADSADGADGSDGLDSLDGLDSDPCGAAGCVSVCGDAQLGDDEVCDDGNSEGGDGCAADCSEVEAGFICPRPGEACRAFVRCGDGIVAFPEQCDDGNAEGSDGCSAHCKLEDGYKCSGTPSSCTETTCGDGIVEGTEGCDEGDTIPFDGCSDRCQKEPTCGDDGCTSECGDGLVLDEDCDDGNRIDGDGCSADCEVEEGSICESSECEMQGKNCVVRVPVIYRDFLEAHSDFQPGCHSTTEITGIVQSTLVNGKPALSNPLPGNTCISNFGDWYNDVQNVNASVVGEIVLFENGNGGYVNRWKDDGSQFISRTSTPKDGQPFFFPLDGLGITGDGEYATATVGLEYTDEGGAETYFPESTWATPAPKHNFHFTSQVQYWFRYDAAATASLAFTGDDDVWVFINGKLAVDLGGLHVPRSGSVTISSATAGTYGLTDGKVYPIHIFHAERKKDGSSFRLTLKGLGMGRSDCESYCGDGVIGPDEECDDSVNDGGYNECQPGCVLGGYCGDGIVQAEERCDFRAPDAPSGCTSGCTILIVE